MELLKINYQNLDQFTTDFLIVNEENIDWESLSQFKGRSFSLAEIRMFRKSIQWNLYLINHALNEIELDVAAKHFTDSVFNVISAFVNLSEKFIRKYKDRLSWRYLIRKSNLSEDFLFEMEEYWTKLPRETIIDGFSMNQYIDLTLDSYRRLALYLKLNS